MDFHTIKAGCDSAAGTVDKLSDNPLNVGVRHLLGDGFFEFSAEAAHWGAAANGRGGLRVSTAEQIGVADATAVHNLHEDISASTVDGVGDCTPPGDMFLGGDARLAGEGAVAKGREYTFGDDEGGSICPGALLIVGGVRSSGGAVFAGASAGERRHDDAVAQLHLTDADGAVEGRCLGHECSFSDQG